MGMEEEVTVVERMRRWESPEVFYNLSTERGARECMKEVF